MHRQARYTQRKGVKKERLCGRSSVICMRAGTYTEMPGTAFLTASTMQIAR